MKNPIAADVAALEAGRDRLAQDIATIAGEAADTLKDAGGAQLRRAQDALTAARVAVRRRSRGAIDATGEYVNDHPWQALGLAALVGALAGLLLMRR